MSTAATTAGRSDAIDILKALAILGVLVQHTVPGDQLADVGRNVWIRPAVPIFFVLVGLNFMGAVDRSRSSGTWDGAAAFLRRRLNRIVGPLLVVALAAYAIAAVRGSLDPTPALAVGALPIDGPGNYFVTALVGIVLIFPALAWAFRRRPALTLVGCIVLNVIVEVVMLRGLDIASDLRAGDEPYAYPAFPLRYVGAVAMGMWISRGAELTARRNLPLVALAVPSVGFLVALDLGEDPLGWFPDSFEKAMSVFAAPWALLLVLVALRLLPRSVGPGVPGRALVALGRMSWHVYLVQLVWLGVVVDNQRSLGLAPLNIAACLLLGWLLFRAVPDTHIGSWRRRDPLTS